MQPNLRQPATRQPYQRPVRTSAEPAVVMDPLVHGGGAVAGPLSDIIHTDDVRGLYVERPRGGKGHLTKNVQPERSGASRRGKWHLVPHQKGDAPG